MHTHANEKTLFICCCACFCWFTFVFITIVVVMFMSMCERDFVFFLSFLLSFFLCLLAEHYAVNLLGVCDVSFL